MDKKQQQEAYKQYVKQKTPVHSLPVNMFRAFLTGGIICTIGQFILNYCEKLGMDKDTSGGWTSVILILMSVLLTGFNLYPRIAKWAVQEHWFRLQGLQTVWHPVQLSFKKRGRYLGLDARYLR